MLYFFIVIFAILIDQGTKYLSVAELKGQQSISLIDGFLYLTYVENKGAAFGIFQNARVFFILSTVLILGVLILFVRKYALTKLAKISIVLIMAGALGNLIDRIRLGYVVDMIDIIFGKVYDFPVFNFADCCVVVGTVFFAILILTNRYEKKVVENRE